MHLYARLTLNMQIIQITSSTRMIKYSFTETEQLVSKVLEVKVFGNSIEYEYMISTLASFLWHAAMVSGHRLLEAIYDLWSTAEIMIIYLLLSGLFQFLIASPLFPPTLSNVAMKNGIGITEKVMNIYIYSASVKSGTFWKNPRTLPFLS